MSKIAEIMARSYHAEECHDTEASYRRWGWAVPEKWADPWNSGGLRQRQKLERYAQAVLTALEQAGYVVVPKEPTQDMQKAALFFVMRQHQARDIYRAMISASQVQE